MFSFQTLRTQLIEVLHVQESPHHTALAFAVGVFIAFSPTYGFHFVSVVFCAWAFRLNFLALLVGSLVNNPWTVAPILGLTLWTGFLLLGMPDTGSFNWDSLSMDTLVEVILPYILPFAIGGFLLSLAGFCVTYPLAFFLVSRYRKAHRRHEA